MNEDDAAEAGLAEVDTPEALDDETDVVPTGTVSEGAKPTKEPKAPARPTPPATHITPVAFAKELTKHLADKSFQNKNGFVGRTTDGSAIDLKINPIPPQYIYSMINQTHKRNAQGELTAKNPLPTYVSGHGGEIWPTGEQPEGTPIARINLLILDEALAWWDAKDARVAASKADKAAKEKAKAEKAAAAPATEAPATTSGPVVEAE
jgi:hypothetical protein